MAECVSWTLDVMKGTLLLQVLGVASASLALSFVGSDVCGPPPLLAGVMTCLCFIFKHGKREDVVCMAPRVLERLTDCSHAVLADTQLRKLHVKLVQWLGVTFLPPRVAKWRYQRGGRSLEQALAASPAQQVCVCACVRVWVVGVRWLLDVHICTTSGRGEGEGEGGGGGGGGRV